MIGPIAYYIGIKTGIELMDDPKTWEFDAGNATCIVRETECDHDCHAFEVYMILREEGRDSITMQTVIPADADDSDACRAALDMGENPVGAWEDGMGRTVRPENGDVLVIGAYRVEYPLTVSGSDLHGADVVTCEDAEDLRVYLAHPHYGNVTIAPDEDDRSTWIEVPAALCNLRPAEDRDSDEDLVEREEY